MERERERTRGRRVVMWRWDVWGGGYGPWEAGTRTLSRSRRARLMASSRFPFLAVLL